MTQPSDIRGLVEGVTPLQQWALRLVRDIEAGTLAGGISRPIDGKRYVLRDYATYEQEIETLRARARAAEAKVEASRAVLIRLLSGAKLLHANAVGCAQNHYGQDFELHGMPGWIADAQADIDSARAALEGER